MPVSIPCTSSGASRWTQRTSIGGRDYQLTFDWSQRDGHWRLDLADQDGVMIRAGIVLVTNRSLLRGMNDTRLPAGSLVVVDTLAQWADAGFADLGTRFLLLYYDPSEVLA